VTAAAQLNGGNAVAGTFPGGAVTAGYQMPASAAPGFGGTSNPQANQSANAAGLTQLAAGSHALQTVPRGAAPTFGYALPAGEAPPLAQELDALDAQVRQALGEPPYAPKGTSPVAQSYPSDPFDPAEFNRQVQAAFQP
jgi:hypothetical protein